MAIKKAKSNGKPKAKETQVEKKPKSPSTTIPVSHEMRALLEDKKHEYRCNNFNELMVFMIKNQNKNIRKVKTNGKK